MKITLLLIFSFLSGTLLSQVSLWDLKRSKGVYYLNGVRYTGKVIETYEEIDSTDTDIVTFIEYTGHIKNGMKDGEWIYYDNYDIYSIENYTNGLKDGVWKFYNHEGKLKGKITYENGKWIDDTITEYYHRRKFRIGWEHDLRADLWGGSFSIHLHKKHGIYGSFLSVWSKQTGAYHNTVSGDLNTDYPGSVYSGQQEYGSVDDGYSAQLGYFYQFLSRWEFNLNAHVGFGFTTVNSKDYVYSMYNSPSEGKIWVDTKLKSTRITSPSFSSGLIIDMDFIYWYLGYHINPNRFKLGMGFRF